MKQARDACNDRSVPSSSAHSIPWDSLSTPQEQRSPISFSRTFSLGPQLQTRAGSGGKLEVCNYRGSLALSRNATVGRTPQGGEGRSDVEDVANGENIPALETIAFASSLSSIFGSTYSHPHLPLQVHFKNFRGFPALSLASPERPS